jgi:hypothetical protein
MAAQFEDERLGMDYPISLPSGLYKIRIIQLVDPSEAFWEVLGENPAFLLEYERCTTTPPPSWETIPWTGRPTPRPAYLPEGPRTLDAATAQEVAAIETELTKEFVHLMNEAQPGWSRAFVRFEATENSYGSQGPSYEQDSEMRILDSMKHPARSTLLRWMGEQVQRLFLLQRTPRAVLVLAVTPDGRCEMKYEYRNLSRYRITLIDGGTGIPEGF